MIKTLGVNNTVSYFVAANLLLASVYSPFIQEVTPVHVLSAVLTVFVVVLSFSNLILLRRVKYIEALFLLIAASYFVIGLMYYLNGVNSADLLRSYLPFIYLPAYAFLCFRLNAPNIIFLLKCIFFIGYAICLLVIPFFIELLVLKSLNFNRFTAYSDMSHTPIMIITIPLIYMLVPKYKYVFLAVVVVALLATQSKGMILFGGAAIFLSEMSGNRVGLNGVIRIGLLIVVLSIPFFVFKDTLVDRFANITGNTSMHRVEEIIVASKYISANPWLGEGPGTVFRVKSATALGDGEQRYIHNVVIYMLATGGVVGLLLYMIPFYCVHKNRRYTGKIVYVAIVCSFLYLLVSATFKSIQTNMILGVLIGCCLSLNRASRKNCGE